MAEYFLKRRAKPSQIFKYCWGLAVKRSFKEWVPKLSLGTRKPGKRKGGSRLDNWLLRIALAPYSHEKMGTDSACSSPCFACFGLWPLVTDHCYSTVTWQGQDAFVVVVNHLAITTCSPKASCHANYDLASRVGTNRQ
jgi:hypothetical protein